MQDDDLKPERLPFGVLQSIILTLEECRDHASQAKVAAKLQIQHTLRLQQLDRDRMLPVVKGQLLYWETVEKAINWLNHRVTQRMRWPAKLKHLSEQELMQLGMDKSLREVMKWNSLEETTKV